MKRFLFGTLRVLAVVTLLVILAAVLSVKLPEETAKRNERREAACRYRVSVAMLPYLDNPRAPQVAAALYDDCLTARMWE